LHGEYEKALGAIKRAFQEIDDFNMEFARPHILVSSAAANIGLQRFRMAQHALAEVEELAIDRRDDYVLTNAKTVSARLFLQRGMPDRALDVISHQWTRTPSPCMEAEFLVTRAACFACLDRYDEALSLVDELQTLSSYLEPQLLARWVRVLCHMGLKEPDTTQEIRRTFESSVKEGAIDTCVFAYRLHPDIIEVLAAQPDLKAPLASILVKAGDSAGGRSNGLVLAAETTSALAAKLTKREKEVFGLLAKGRTNREIAQALVISEVTAKVHVRNVLRKLGARNRTEAAVMAARMQGG
jgi:DNA-binding CsgD family transcriptional regulator